MESSTDNQNVLLEGEFFMYAITIAPFRVTVTQNTLFYNQLVSGKYQYKEEKLQISDVIGCDFSNTDNLTGFTVFAYPFRNRKNLFNGTWTRQRIALTFEAASHLSLEEKQKTALQWKNVINSLAKGLSVKLCDVETCEPPPWGRLLILVNPHSGTGKAVQIFKDQVEPMLEEASIPFKLITTEYAGHAKELVQSMDLYDWAGVVIVSGDGLIYEVINGLMQRVDWRAAIKTPLGCVPGGSGNALASSISYAAGEPLHVNPVLHSTFLLIKHRVLPMDLVLVQTPTSYYHSFLSVTWGLIADVDFESERYRSLGEVRFTVGAFKSIINIRAYAGKLSFLPVAKYSPKSSQAASNGPKRAGSFSSQGVITSPTQPARPYAHTISSCCNVDIPSQQANPCSVGSKSSKFKAMNQMTDKNGATVVSSSSVNGHLASNSDETKQQKSQNYVGTIEHENDNAGSVEKENKVENDNGCFMENGNIVEDECGGDEDEEDDSAMPRVSVPALDQPVPSDWVVIEDKFIMVCAFYQTHIGSDMLMAPFARLSDRVIHLMFVREGISRYRLLNILLSFSKGTHIDSPDVEFLPVLAFRLEPGEEDGHIMIDGELIDPVPLQGHVLPGMARVMAIQ